MRRTPWMTLGLVVLGLVASAGEALAQQPASLSWTPELPMGPRQQISRAVNQLEAGERVTPRERRAARPLKDAGEAVVALASATGVNIHPDGLVLTAWHNVKPYARPGGVLNVRFASGRGAKGRVVSYSTAHNLALVRLDAGVYPSAPVAASPARVGDPVWVLGFPKEISGIQNFRASFGHLRAAKTVSGQVAYDAWTYWGHGGAPVLNERGEIVSVHTSWDPQTRMRLGRTLGSIQAFLKLAGQAPGARGGASTTPAPAAAPAPAPRASLRPADRTISAAHAAQLRRAINGIERGDWTTREALIAREITRVHAASVNVGGGSGVVLTPDGAVLTAYHVVDDHLNRPITVTFPDGTRHAARVVATSKAADLAIVRLPKPTGRAYPHATVARAEPAVGEVVVLVGNPGAKSGRLPFHTSAGEVLWYGPRRGILGDLAYDAWTYWGHSGCPVFNARGQVAGVHNSWDSNNAWRHGLRLKTVRAFLKAALPEVL